MGLSGVLFAFLVIDSRLQGVSISRYARTVGAGVLWLRSASPAGEHAGCGS